MSNFKQEMKDYIERVKNKQPSVNNVTIFTGTQNYKEVSDALKEINTGENSFITNDAGLDEFHEAMKQDFYNSLGAAQILPVITLYQPWATWIMRGWKTIETRTHNRFNKLLGRKILIHAGLRTDMNSIHNPYLTQEQLMQDPDEVVNGFILGSAFVHNTGLLYPKDSKDALIDCANTRRYGLFLNNIEKWELPIAEKGEVGIWYYDVVNFKKVKKPV